MAKGHKASWQVVLDLLSVADATTCDDFHHDNRLLAAHRRASSYADSFPTFQPLDYLVLS